MIFKTIDVVKTLNEINRFIYFGLFKRVLAKIFTEKNTRDKQKVDVYVNIYHYVMFRL